MYGQYIVAWIILTVFFHSHYEFRLSKQHGFHLHDSAAYNRGRDAAYSIILHFILTGTQINEAARYHIKVIKSYCAHGLCRLFSHTDNLLFCDWVNRIRAMFWLIWRLTIWRISWPSTCLLCLQLNLGKNFNY